MSEVLRVHALSMAKQNLALFLVSMFCAMSCLPMVDATPNRSVDVTVSLGPDGISDQFSIEVPDGDIITDFDVKVFEKSWPIDDVVTLDEKSDWSNGDSMDGVDYNLTGLRILPMSHEWTFEGGVQGWTLDSAGGWAHGYDSTLGSTNGVHSGSSAIYTYNGNYPNGMSRTYWATSPIVDCSSCSGTWDLKMWKRLGVESSSYDRAYVAVKTTSGGWTNVYSNPYGSTNDNSYTQASYDISNYVAGNSAFQVRFGLGSTDGSVTYTGWNVDDVTIEPRTNTGTGTANWTSQAFGPSAGGIMEMQHGLLAIDATIPQSSMMKWSLIDATNGSAIPGFIDVQDLSADLSIIDTEKYPLVQLKIQMETTSESPIIHAIKLGGGIIESFSSTTSSWTGFSSNSNGQVSGNGILSSPQWRLVHPFSALEMSWLGTGSGNFEACFSEISSCSSNWKMVPLNGKLMLNQPSNLLNLRWNGTGSYSMDLVHVDLHRQSSPLNARIDVGLDGVSEWSFSNPNIGPWGIQDTFSNGKMSYELSIPSGGSDICELFFPMRGGLADPSYESKANTMLSFTAIGPPVDGVEVTFSVDGFEVFTESLGFISNSASLILSDSQMQDLITQMNSRTPDFNIVEDLDAHKIEISVSSISGGEILVSGLSIPYRYDVHIEEESALPIIDAINSQLSTIQSVGGVKTIPVPIVMTNPGSLTIWDYGIQTLGSPLPTGIMMSNQTDTLVAGNDWYEFNSSFELSNIGVSNAEQHFNNEQWSSVFTLGGNQWTRSLSCSIITDSCNADQGIIAGDFSHSFDGSKVEFYHRIQISSIWPDEEALTVSSSIDMNGPASSPNQIRLGAGWSMGIEQDVEVVDWHLSFMNGAESTWDALYFDPSNPGIVEVELEFEDLDSNPRSSSFNVALYVDGLLSDSTQSLTDGVATLMFTPNPLSSKVDLQISVSSLHGQDVSWNVPKNATFLIDETSPVLISSNVAPLDHRSNDYPLELQFEIGDRPLLPRHAILHVENSWNGQESIHLDYPANLNGVQGTYTTVIDVSQADIGDIMSGWLEVFDPAGHPMEDSGSEESPLFIISFGPDGSPVIQNSGLGWLHSDDWLHPGQNYAMHIPIIDSNGYGDIETVSIDLSSNSNENLIIEWNSVSGCLSSNPSIVVESCTIVGETDHFSEMFTLEVVISFAWDFNPDSSMERSIRITAADDSGQSNRVELDSNWRYSSEMEIDLNSIEFLDSSPFVAPGEISNLSAEVIWTKGGQHVDTMVDLSAMVDDNTQFGLSDNGIANIQLVAPNNTGIYSITLDLYNLPIGAIDRTDSTQIVAWIVVDGNQPKVMELISPRPDSSIKERDWKDLTFEFMVNETEGLDLDSMKMEWLIIPQGMTLPELALLGGNVSMDLIAGTGAGSSIPLAATLDVDAIIPEVSRKNSWDLWVWIEGHDLAGQPIQSLFNSRNSPLAVLQLASRDAEIHIGSEDILVPEEFPKVGQPIFVNITVHNNGQADGLTSVRVEVVEDGDRRRQIEIVNIEVPALSSVTFEVKWVPDYDGTAWIEVSSPGGIFERTNPVQVEPEDSTFVIEGLDGASGPMLTGFAIITFLMIGLLGYLVMSGRKMDEEDFEESEFV